MPLDRFSAQAELYARYRIAYPTELYHWLLPQVASRERAWDCATGNGQVAGVLADHFQHIEATDLSEAQLANAVPHPRIRYQPARAEHTDFPDNYFDLITVAQAVHWFNIEAYHREVRRVARPGAALAEWGYNLVQLDDEPLDELLRRFHDDTLRPYWDDNRWHITDEYSRIPFPFAQVQRAHFEVRRQWSADWFLNYLRTWSAVLTYRKEHRQDAVLLVEEELKRLWGPAGREVMFPVFARAGRL